MDDFNIYEDLEELHAEEKKKAFEDLKWKEKYHVALETIQQLQAEKKDLNKKIKQLEINFASLLDTARTEIKRKDNQIRELRKEKDDICFRRKTFNPERHTNDVNGDEPSVGVRFNPFLREPRKESPNSYEVPVKEKFSSSQSKEMNGDQRKHRKTDLSKQSEKYTQKTEQHRTRSKNRFDDRSRKKSRDRSESRRRNRSRGRLEDRSRNKSRYHSVEENQHSRRDSSDRRKDERRKEKTHKTHDKDRTQAENSDSSWDRKKNYPDEIRNIKNGKRSSKADKDDERKNVRNTPDIQNPPIDKKVNQKIEIIQIEILKDVKEFKKNKLSEAKKEKPPAEDPEKVAIEKSNKFIDALFDDTEIIDHPPDEANNLYDGLEAVHPSNVPADNGVKFQEDTFPKTDENCNIKFATPLKQPITIPLEDLFGPSPASSVMTVADRRSSVTTAAESSCDTVDFVPITSKEIIPMPSAVENKKNTSPDSTSKDILEPEMVVNDSSSEEESKAKSLVSEKSKKDNTNDNPCNTKEQKTFKFVELDSSFYSSDEEEYNCKDVGVSVKDSLSDIESPTFENVLLTGLQKSLPLSRSQSDNSVEKDFNFKSQPTIPQKSSNENEMTEKFKITKTHEASRKHREEEETHEASRKHREEEEKRSNTNKYSSREEQKRSRRTHHSPYKKSGSDDRKHNSSRHHLSSKHEKSSRSSVSSSKNDVNRKHESERHRDHRHHRSKETKTHRRETSHRSSKSSKNSRNHSVHDSKENCFRDTVRDNAGSSPMLVWSDEHESPVKSSLQNEHSNNAPSELQDQVIFLHCDDISDEEGDDFGKEENVLPSSVREPTNDRNENFTLQDTLLANSKEPGETLNEQNELSIKPLESVTLQEPKPKQSYLEFNEPKESSNNQNIGSVELEIDCQPTELEENQTKSTNINHQVVDEKTMFECVENTQCETRSEVIANVVGESQNVLQSQQVELNSKSDNETEVFSQQAETIETQYPNNESKALSVELPLVSCNQQVDLTESESCSLITQGNTEVQANNNSGVAFNTSEENKITEASVKEAVSTETVTSPKIGSATCAHPSDNQQTVTEIGKRFADLCADLNDSFEDIEIVDEVKCFQNDVVKLQLTSEVECDAITTCPLTEPCSLTEPYSSTEPCSGGIMNLLWFSQTDEMPSSNEEGGLSGSTLLGVITNAEKEFKKDSNVDIFNKATIEEIEPTTIAVMDGPISHSNLACGLQLSMNVQNVEKGQKKNSDDANEESGEISNSENVQECELKNLHDSESDMPFRTEDCNKIQEAPKIADGESLANVSNGSEISLTNVEITSSTIGFEQLSIPNLAESVDKVVTSTEVQTLVSSNSESMPSSNNSQLEKISVSASTTPQSLIETINQSASEDVPSGRRKKLKTPRKCPDDVTKSSSTLVGIVTRRYSKSEEGRSFYSNEFVQLSMRRTQSSSNLNFIEEEVEGSQPVGNLEDGGNNQPGKTQQKCLDSKEDEKPHFEGGDQSTSHPEQKLENPPEKEIPVNLQRRAQKEARIQKLLHIENEVEETLTKVLGLEPMTKELSNVSVSAPTKSKCVSYSTRDAEYSQEVLSETTTDSQQEDSIYEQNKNSEELNENEEEVVNGKEITETEEEREFNQADLASRITSENANLSNQNPYKSASINENAINCTGGKLSEDKNRRENERKLSTPDKERDLESVSSNENLENRNFEKSNPTNEKSTICTDVELSEGNNKSENKSQQNLLDVEQYVEAFTVAKTENRTKKNSKVRAKTNAKNTIDSTDVLQEATNSSHDSSTLYSKEANVRDCTGNRHSAKDLEKQNGQNLIENNDNDIRLTDPICSTGNHNSAKDLEKQNGQNLIENTDNGIRLTDPISSKPEGNTTPHVAEESTLKDSISKNQPMHDQSMMMHFMDSDHALVGTNECESVPLSKRITKSKNTGTSTTKRKRKKSLVSADFEKEYSSTVSSKDIELSSDCAKPKIKSKRKYKRTIKHCESSEESTFLEHSIDHYPPKFSNDCKNTNEINDFIQTANCDLMTSKKKRKNKKSISPSAESSDPNILKLKPSTEPSVNHMEILDHVEEVLNQLHSPSISTNVTASTISPSKTVEDSEKSSEQSSHVWPDSTHSTDTSLNGSFSTEKTEKSSAHKRKKKPRESKKRKLSGCDEPVARSKKSKTQDLPETTLDDWNAKAPSLTIESENNKSPPHEEVVSVALTPTHHKIFLNDAFPENPPPPVYNINEEDVQYQEIDNRMRSMFQSPSYSQTAIGGECSFEKSNGNESNSNDNNLTIEETLNQSKGSQCDGLTTSKKVSLGSKDYVIETVGTHTANVFITRKKCKKRVKVAAAT